MIAQAQPRNWRNCISSWIVFHGKSLKLLSEHETGWSTLPPHVLKVITPLADELLTAATAHENLHLRTIAAVERIINRRIWNALTPFSNARLGLFQQLEFDPYSSPESTRAWCAQIDREDPLDAAARAAAATQRRTHTG